LVFWGFVPGVVWARPHAGGQTRPGGIDKGAVEQMVAAKRPLSSLWGLGRPGVVPAIATPQGPTFPRKGASCPSTAELRVDQEEAAVGRPRVPPRTAPPAQSPVGSQLGLCVTCPVAKGAFVRLFGQHHNTENGFTASKIDSAGLGRLFSADRRRRASAGPSRAGGQPSPRALCRGKRLCQLALHLAGQRRVVVQQEPQAPDVVS
jgi:hypothetical protein